MKTVILDGQALFYMQKDPLPPKLERIQGFLEVKSIKMVKGVIS